MGDRGNIKIGKIYLYAHCGGSEIKQVLKRALSRRQRWDDEPYSTRIIFEEMVGDETGTATGYGISTKICDNEYPILEVDCSLQEIKCDGLVWTFEEFINQKFEVDI